MFKKLFSVFNFSQIYKYYYINLDCVFMLRVVVVSPKTVLNIIRRLYTAGCMDGQMDG